MLTLSTIHYAQIVPLLRNLHFVLTVIIFFPFVSLNFPPLLPTLLISSLSVVYRPRHYKAMTRPVFPVILSVLLSILPYVSLVTSNCYCVRDGQVIDCSGTETACSTPSSVDSGAQLCCVTGDQCGKDSICHFTKQIANTSGYYLGGCTDPTYKDPVCQQHCSQYHILIPHVAEEVCGFRRDGPSEKQENNLLT
jgi:hypothetical protein